MMTNKRPLAKGQVWKTRAAAIEIMALGQGCIHYKVIKQLGIKQVSAQVSGIEALTNYLKLHEARLTKAPANN